jgi:hypothetical protein
MSGAGAVGAALCTIAFANPRVRAPKRVLLVNTTATALAATNLQATTYALTSFAILIGSVALAAGTYTFDYLVIG